MKNSASSLHYQAKDTTLDLISDVPFYNHLLDITSDIICSIDEKGKFIFVNAAVKYKWGYEPTELIGKSFIDLIHEEDRIPTLRNLIRIKTSIQKMDFESRCISKNGKIICFNWNVNFDATKHTFCCIIKEVTIINQAEGKYNCQTFQLHRAYKLAKLAWWEYDLTTEICTCSNEVFDMYGQPRTENNQITLEQFFNFVHPDDVSYLQMRLSSIDNAAVATYEHRIIKPGGQIIEVIHYAEAIMNTEGKAIRLLGTVQDVTKQKEAESLIRISEEKYKLLFKQSTIPKLIFNINSLRIVEVNDAALELYGYSREEFLNLIIADLRPPEDRQALYDIIKQNMDNKISVFSSIHRHKKKNNELFYVQIEANVIHLPSGPHSLVVAIDMTEKLQMQKRIIQEKVAAQKEIARAIIQTQENERKEISKELHDNVNQILTTIKLYIENIQSFPDQQATFIRKSVSLTQKAIDEIRLLSKKLISPVITDLNFKAAVIEMIDHYRSLNIFNVHYTCSINEDQLDKDLLLTIYRIIQEQLNNIVKHAKATDVSIHVVQKQKLEVSIIDNGVGFELKNNKNGMGINNMKNRAEVYKGAVCLESSIGKGCSLHITFPLSNQSHYN